MVQKGDYQETLARSGDCAVESRNLLKYLKNKWWGRRESDLRPKNIYFNIFKLLAHVVFFQGLLGDLFAKILTFIWPNYIQYGHWKSWTFTMLTMIKHPNLIERSCLEEWSRRGTIWRLFSALGTVQLSLANYWNIWKILMVEAAGVEPSPQKQFFQ